MPSFKAVLIEHGYASTEHERRIIEDAGGEFIDAEKLPLVEALSLCEDANGILFRRIEVTAEMICRFRRCRGIVRYGIGTDNVDMQAATEAGIVVSHVPAYCIDEVSSHAIALLLACVRRIVGTHEKVGAGRWDVHREEPIHRMAGKTLGIVGFGKIGRAVARKMAGWDLRVLAADPFVERSEAAGLGVELRPLDELLRESDYITLHAPLLPETRHLMGRKTLALCQRGAILVNTSRGPVIDTEALMAALDEGGLSYAALDVFEDEPLPNGSPLRCHSKIILSDHTAWYSEESQLELQQRAAAALVQICTGALPDAIANPEVLDRLGRSGEWVPQPGARWQLKRLERLGAVRAFKP